MNQREGNDFHGSALCALRQTAGRGRRGNEWFTGEGNLALSLAFRAPSGTVATLFSCLVGLAAFSLLRPLLAPSVDLRLKWPNDIYLNGRKLAGLLAQARQGESFTDVVVGIGLNLREAPPALGQEVAALAEFMVAPEPLEFARALLGQVERYCAELKNFEELRGRWEEAARLAQTEVRVVGEEEYWRPVALLPTGELEVMGPAGKRKLASETVSIRIR